MAEWKLRSKCMQEQLSRWRIVEMNVGFFGLQFSFFDRETGALDPDLPPAGCGLRWTEFIDQMAETYQARFGEI